jgi:glyceraldehyde 3-phosphate dehydrogenase
MVKVGINGFGRIGRVALRIILQSRRQEILPVLINTSGKMEAEGWAQLFKYDSVYGQYSGEIKTEGRSMIVDGLAIPVSGESDPSVIPWGDYGAEIVIESTGVFLTKEQAGKHLRDTVKKVILAAPPKDEQTPLFVIGVNDQDLKEEKIISCASCTTNCLAPLIKVIHENLGIKKAVMSTIHAYTSDQELLDGSHKDLRRARAAGLNIVPTTTGAAKSAAKVYPAVKDRFDGLAFRVPVACGSLCDLTFVSQKAVTVEEINNIFRQAADNNYKGIIKTTNEPLVSSDIIGSQASAIVDLSLTQVVANDLVKIVAWYDNEWGYASRLVEEVILAGKSQYET